MTDTPHHDFPGLVWLCGLLGLVGLILAGLGLWLFLSGLPLYGLLSLCVSGLSTAAAWGLYRRKKWGIFLFGLVGLLGAVNHLASTLYRNADLSQAGAAQVLGVLFSLVLAILIPIGLIYLVLLLWRRF